MIPRGFFERVSIDRRGGHMKGRIWTVAVGLAAVAALIAVPAAMAAYTSPKLEVQQTGTTTTFRLTQSFDEDPTAVASIFVPPGTTLTTSQAPGTVLGKASARLRLRGLADADVPVEGNVVVASIGPDPTKGQVSPETQQRCTQGVTPLATWILSVSVAGVAVPVPVFLVPSTTPFTELGPAYVRACFTSPYLTVDRGGLTGQPQVVNAAFSVQGVFSTVPVGAFVAILVPWTVGTATPNPAATVATPAAIAPGAVTIRATRSGAGATVTGSVTQAGEPRGATVTIAGGATKAKLTRTKRVKVGASGKFAAKFPVGTFFRATAVATSGAAPPLCTRYAALQALGIQCINPTVNGFSVKSKVVKKK
jgi:hypothetical protein